MSALSVHRIVFTKKGFAKTEDYETDLEMAKSCFKKKVASCRLKSHFWSKDSGTFFYLLA
jgi:hypothetical protein